MWQDFSSLLGVYESMPLCRWDIVMLPGFNQVLSLSVSFSLLVSLSLSFSLSLSLSLSIYIYSCEGGFFRSLDFCLSLSFLSPSLSPPYESETWSSYGVATISRLLKIIGLFCERALINRLYSAKETHNVSETWSCYGVLRLVGSL